MNAAYDNLVGQQLAGRYEVESLLGTGGMGAVYRARQLDLGRPVALKVLRQELASDAGQLERFRREALAAASLGHRNVVQVTDLHVVPGELAFLVMELVEGRSLAQVIEAEGRLEVGRVIALGQQVLSALQAAHDAGIVHRDVKPPNIMLEEFPVVGEVVKLLDFGVVKMHDGAGAATLTQTGVSIGTPAYMSPEQLLGKAVDHRTDIYAVGVVMFKALAGRLPFEPGIGGLDRLMRPALSLDEVVPGMAREVTAAVAMALASEPENRFQSADEMAAALAQAAQTVGSAAAAATIDGVPTLADEAAARPASSWQDRVAPDEETCEPTSFERPAPTPPEAFVQAVQASPTTFQTPTAPASSETARLGTGQRIAIVATALALLLLAIGGGFLLATRPWVDSRPAALVTASDIPHPVTLPGQQPTASTARPASAVEAESLPPLEPLGPLTDMEPLVCSGQCLVSAVNIEGGEGAALIAADGSELTVLDSRLSGLFGIQTAGTATVRLRNCRVDAQLWGLYASANGRLEVDGGIIRGGLGAAHAADYSVITLRSTRLEGRTSAGPDARVDWTR